MEWIRKYHIAIAWTIATSAMLISLFFSEWMKLHHVICAGTKEWPCIH